MEVPMTRKALAAILFLSVMTSGCDLLDPVRPTPHEDTNLFGNLIEVTPDEAEEGIWWVRVRIGMPRAFTQAEKEGGKPTPTLEQGIVADVVVSSDTVVLAEGAPAFIEDVAPGSEVVVVPRPGSTRMIGTSNITVEAAYFLDFETFRGWQLPGLEEDGAAAVPVEDPGRINSSGIEGAPVPLNGGRVLYFSARLRTPAASGEPWLGARRDGLVEPAEGELTIERSYRTSLGEGGWSPPELVAFPDTDDAAVVQVSWVSEDELECLVTVVDREGLSTVGRSERSSPGSAWGEIVRLEEVIGDNPSHAVYLAGSDSKLVYTASVGGNPSTDLLLFDPSVAELPQLLTPPINSAAAEWGARVGPDNELFFVRGDRQYMVADGNVRPVGIPVPHRAVITQAAPTTDGEWVFLVLPTFVPAELDQDIYVSRWAGENRLDMPVPVDDWRP
jgi:hypothetical protein